ncbi:spermidine synthase [Legionella cardiaca]|uniref:Fused MFS/spermidine synthase n=1 Tax=Legionella cardiaca TaxID=1071983 RepID=A0ABY8AW19_9GAMM|nr:fused MFS/spermidine synthase [Legionella cardiaca]WED43705.1 fused MFS/spermidine synthase [Legionella cardiaca]
MQIIFSIGLFLSAGLLFSIQPMVAKALLPVYGGTPAVWTVCMLFFQSLLLFAYGYTWLLSRSSTVWGWRLPHAFLILLSFLSLPLIFAISSQQGAPEFTILHNLVYQLGLPLLVIAASAPLLQFAYSQTKDKKASDPYFLYAASNIGSLLALIAYPWLIERYMGLNEQFYFWNIGYCIYIILLFFIFFGLSYQRLLRLPQDKAHLSWMTIFQWIAYSFIPCSLLLGVTFYISADIAAAPVFWILPLALYLLSFVITFAKRPIISFEWIERNILVFFIFPLLGFIFAGNLLQSWQFILFHLLNFFMFSLLCHAQLVKSRPPANQLTIFYFCLALGGVLAGLFNSLLAPKIFSGSYEYPFVLVLATLCIPGTKLKTINSMPLIVLSLLFINSYLSDIGFLLELKKYHVAEVLALGIIMIWPGNKVSFFMGVSLLLIFLFSPSLKDNKVLTQQRNFYGIKRVLSTIGSHALISQNTLHGFQLSGAYKNNGSMGYYGPAAEVVELLQQEKASLNSIILGLGTGMMACQYRKDDQVKMVDIDKQVINIANNAQWFTYLKDCPPKISVQEGDGRLVLQNAKAAKADLVVIDAFSSDAIPVHLLTLEAFKLYSQKIIPNGVILAHVSNRHLRLLPVLTAAGRQLELIVLHKLQSEDPKMGQMASEWALLTANQQIAGLLMQKGWRFVSENESYLWTDNYSNLIPLLKW